MQKILSFLSQKFSLIMIAALIIGICFQDLAAFINPAIKILLMFGIYLSLLKIDLSVLKGEIKKPMLQIYILLFTNFLLPITLFLIMKTVCYIFQLDMQWAIAVLVLFGAPTATMTPAICILMRGHVERAIINMLVSSLLVPFSLPFIIRLMNGQSVTFDTLHMVLDLLQMIAIPILLAIISKILFKEFCRKTIPYIAPVSVVIVAIVVLGCVDGLTAIILKDPSKLIVGTIIAFSMALLAFTIGWLSAYKGTTQDRVTMAIFSTWPNVGLVIVISNLYFKTQYPIILLFAIIYEIPWNTTFAPAQKFIEWTYKKSPENLIKD